MEIGKNYSVPDVRLFPDLVGYTNKIYDKFTTNDTDALVVAQLLEHKSVSGAFNAKTALMGAYGLIDRRSGKIRVTEIGRKIVYPSNSKEKYEGVKAAIFQIPLWDRLYQEYTTKGATLPSNFWADLARLADISPDEAKAKSEWVEKAYNTDVSYLKSVEKEMGTLGSSQGGQTLPLTPQSGAGMVDQGQTRGANAEVIARPLGGFESGKIYFISPDDKIMNESPRNAWQIDLLRTYINGVLDHAKEQLVNDAKIITEKEKGKKPEGK
jgi:hypothetical protein